MGEDEDEEGDDENGLNKSQASILTGRPMSGKEARQQRSARIRAGLAGGQPLEADRFYGLTERMGRMEATIGPILNKLDSVLLRLDNMKRARMQKANAKTGSDGEGEGGGSRPGTSGGIEA